MITAESVAPIMETVTSNLTVLLPVGVGIMGLMIGIKLIPKVVNKFLK